jgi:hypothetical protein
MFSFHLSLRAHIVGLGPLTNSPEDDSSWAIVFTDMFTKDQAREAEKYGHHSLMAVFIGGCV